MPSKNSGTRNSRRNRGSPSGSEDLGHALAAPVSPEESEVSDRRAPPGVPGTVAVLSSPAPVYVTEEVFSSALGGLEERLSALIAASLSQEKSARSPSPPSECLLTEQQSHTEVDLPEGDQDEVDSVVEESTVEEPFSASHAERLWVQSLTNMVRSAFKMPLAEPSSTSVSSLGSLKAPQTVCSFPIHPLLEGLIYQDWEHPDKIFTPPKRFPVVYPMEDKFIRKWRVPTVDAAISCVNKSLTCPVENVQMFKDPIDKKLESLLKSAFSTAGLVTQPAVAAIGVCQAVKDQLKQVLRDAPDQQALALADLPRALCFAVDAIKDSIHQASRLTLSVVHMRRLLWLKNWSAEAPCKKLLVSFPFHGERLFGEDLDKYIQRISSGKSTLLPVKNRVRGPSFKRPASPVPRTSAVKQFRRPPRSNSGGKNQGQLQGNKKPWSRRGTKPPPKSNA